MLHVYSLDSIDSATLQTLRDCCRDDAAFDRLLAILTARPDNPGAKTGDRMDLAPPETARRLRVLLDAIPDSIFRIRRDGTYLDVKAERASDFATPPRTMVGKTVRDELPGDVAARCLVKIQRVLETGQMQVFEYQLPKQGTLHDYEARVVPSGDDEVVTIVRDITERKQAEAALRESEEKFLKAFHASPNAISICTLAEGRYVEVNDTFLRLFDCDRATVIGCTAAELGVWADSGEREKLVSRLQAEGTVRNQEVWLRSRSGRRISGLVSAERIDLGGLPCMLAIVTGITECKAIEEQLLQTTSNLQAIFRAYPDMQFRISADGRVLGYQGGNQAQTYVPPERFLNQFMRDHLPPDVADHLERAIAEVLATKTLVRVEYSLPMPDGDRVYESRLVPLFEREVISLVRDITEQKRTEASLRQSEEKFAKAFRSTPVALAISTLPEGRIVEVNETFLQVSGFSREEVIGNTTIALGLWHNLDDRASMFDLLRTQGRVRNLECEFRRKSGEIAIGLFSAEAIEFDGQPCILSMTNDITDRKRAEAQLQASQERDRFLAEIALRIRRSLNLDQILHTAVEEVRQLLKADRVFIGRATCRGRGCIMAESVDERRSSILGWVADPAYMQELQAIFADGVSQVIDDVTRIEASDLRAELFERYEVKAALGVPIVVGQGLYGVLVAHQCDVPRRWQPFEVELMEKLASHVAIAIQQAELYGQVQALNATLESQVKERTLELEQKVRELETLSEQKDFLLHAVSHDLRTPVMGMLLVLRNLLGKADSQGDPPPATVPVPRKVLERAIQSSDRQLEMLNLLLDSHALECGAALQCEPVTLADLFDTILPDLEPLLERNRAILHNRIPRTLPPIPLDRKYARRVVENLIVNALKHNPPGLHLTLEAELVGEAVRCSISDNGAGLEDGDRLFERYARGKHARYSTGIGLGLYLCRQIVSAHGGQIGADSTPGHGATFWFTLPLGSGGSAPPAAEIGAG